MRFILTTYKFGRITLFFLLFGKFSLSAQSEWTAEENQFVIKLNNAVVREIQDNQHKLLFSAVTSRFDTVALLKTTSRYFPVVSRGDLVLNTTHREFEGGSWGHIAMFTNEWFSPDSSEHAQVQIDIAKYKGSFFIIWMNFDGNVNSLRPFEYYEADSVNALLMYAVQKKDFATINNLFRSDYHPDQELLRKSVLTYDSLIVDTSFHYTSDVANPAENFPNNGMSWQAVAENKWESSKNPSFRVTAYIKRENGEYYISQLVFSSEEKGADTIAFPGGIYKNTGDDDIPPPPPPPPAPR